MSNWQDTLQGETGNNIKNILGILSGLEDRMDTPSILDNGDKIVGKMLKDFAKEINIYPGGVPGTCHRTLLIAIGLNDDVEKSVLQAVKHVNVLCPKTTTNVIFWAAHWDSIAWFKNRDCFPRVNVMLKPFFADVSQL